MTTYDIDVNKTSIEILPPDKRYPANIALIESLMSAMQWIHDAFFKSYYEGSTALEYTPGTYAYQAEVTYNNQVYSSLKSNNTDAPTVATSWYMIQDNFIGIKERVKYNGGRLILEYALNKEYGTTFRQPTTPERITDIKSDIYLTNSSSLKTGFFVGQTEPFCSSVGQTTASDWIGSVLPFVYTNNFVIHIPSATLALTNDQAIGNFVNKYIPESLLFTIISY